MLKTTSEAMKATFEIKHNNTCFKEPCACCGKTHKADIGPWIFLQGTSRTICWDCCDEHTQQHLTQQQNIYVLTEQLRRNSPPFNGV